MKKYPILIGLVGLIGLSIIRVSSIASASAPLPVQEIRKKVEANPYLYAPAIARINKLLEDYDLLIKKYNKATDPKTRSDIKNQIDDIKKELNKWVS